MVCKEFSAGLGPCYAYQCTVSLVGANFAEMIVVIVVQFLINTGAEVLSSSQVST